ncbi:MAG: hypothetical protein LBS22_00030 [Puniceicoccales bacterium]|jgi:hypothetical protein|nr:hypothetical protein [Puniceicoccales bacterium]
MGWFWDKIVLRQSGSPFRIFLFGILAFLIAAVSPISSKAWVANEFIDGLWQNIRDGGPKKISTSSGGVTYSIGDLSTIGRTGDFSIDYDTNTGAIRVSGGARFENFYIKSSDGRKISFVDNSIFSKADLIMALEPVITTQEAHAERLV